MARSPYVRQSDVEDAFREMSDKIKALPVGGDMVKANNLADLPDKAAARTNLGVYSTAEVDQAIADATAGGGGSGDVVGPGGVTADSLAQFDGTTGKLLKGGPLLGVGAAGSVLRRSDGDARYRLAATALTIADTTGLQGALDNKQPLATGLTALAGLSTAGIYYLSAPGVWSQVTIGSGLTFTTGTLSATGGGGGSGDVVGPASATADAPAVFNGTTGKLIKVGAFPVLSVAGLTGAITGAGLKTALALVKGDVGLGNVDNTSDANKPVSTAQQAALDTKLTAANMAALKPPEFFTVAVSDETTNITTGTAKVTFRMPYAFTLTGIRASLTTASTSGLPQVAVKENGVSILSTNITIDANEKTSTTAATLPVISDASLADDAEITIDIIAAGTGAKGLKVTFLGNRT